MAMPTVKGWHVQMPKCLDTSRVVKRSLMERVGMLVKGNVVPRPIWYDVALCHPPPSKIRLKKPKPLSFPEDELRRTWLRRNPAATMHPKALFLEDDAVPLPYRTHPADTFVDRQMELIQTGMGEEEAYKATEAEQKRSEQVASLEAETARQQAEAMGAGSADSKPAGHVRTLMQQQLLRRFAEEARDQGLPYPKHWFDADGSWLGIGFNQFRDQLPGKTRRALNYATAEADAVQDVLGVRPDPSDAMGEDRGYDRASPSDSSRRRL